MSAPAVRPAHPAELAGLAEAIAAAPLLRRYGSSAPGIERALAAAGERGEVVLVAEDADGGRGLAWFRTAGTLGLGGYLRLLAVAPGGERRGLGAALLAEVERATAADSANLFLLCDAENAGARRFYRRAGYRESGSLPGLVRPGIDEILLWKALAAGSAAAAVKGTRPAPGPR